MRKALLHLGHLAGCLGLVRLEAGRRLFLGLPLLWLSSPFELLWVEEPVEGLRTDTAEAELLPLWVEGDARLFEFP